MTEAIDIDEVNRIARNLAIIAATDPIHDKSITEAVALIRSIIPQDADHRRLAGHLASLAGHSMDKALGLC